MLTVNESQTVTVRTVTTVTELPEITRKFLSNISKNKYMMDVTYMTEVKNNEF